MPVEWGWEKEKTALHEKNDLIYSKYNWVTESQKSYINDAWSWKIK